MEAEANAKAQSTSGESESTGDKQTPAPASAPEETEAPTEVKEVSAESPQGEMAEAEVTDEELLSSLKAKGQKRFRELSARAAKADELEKRIAYLEEFLKSNQPPVTTQEPVESESVPSGLPWELPKAPLEPREVTEEEYAEDVGKKAKEEASKLVQSELRRYDALNRELQTLQRDIDIVEGEFPELNAGKRDPVTEELVEPNPNYNEELAVKVTQWYKERKRANPSLRFVTFVRELMNLRSQGAEQGRREISAEVVRQAANQAIVPSGATAKGQTLESMIDEARNFKDLDEVEKLLPHA
jgi:hypothetical protein